MAKAIKKPSVRGLLKLLGETPIKIVERAILDGKIVTGYCKDEDEDGRDDKIYVGLQGNRAWSKADSVVLTVIHELVHIHSDKHTESQARQWETEFFRSPRLREAVLVRLLNIILFEKKK